MVVRNIEKAIEGDTANEQMTDLAKKNQNRILTISDCEATTDTGGVGGAWDGSTSGPTLTAGTSHARVGTNAIKIAWPDTSLNTYGYFRPTNQLDLSSYKYIGFWASHDEAANTEWDAAGDLKVQFYDAGGNKLWEAGCAVTTEFLNAFRLHGDVPHYFEFELDNSSYLQTGYGASDLARIYEIRWVAATTEKGNSKSLYVDQVEAYDIGTGAGPLRYGTLKRVYFSAAVDRGLPVGWSDLIRCQVGLAADNTELVAGISAQTMTAAGWGYIIDSGIVNLIFQESAVVGEGVMMNGASSNSTGYDVDDGAGDTQISYFAKVLETSSASGQHPCLLICNAPAVTYSA